MNRLQNYVCIALGLLLFLSNGFGQQAPTPEKTVVWSKVENGYQVQLIRENNHEYILRTHLELLQKVQNDSVNLQAVHYVLPDYSENYVIPELQTDELIQNRFATMYTNMPMDFNPQVRKEIDRFLVNRRLIEESVGRSKYFIPICDSVMNERLHLPRELKYLPLVESNFKPKSQSRVGASGIWQFMTGTGRMYGLQVNRSVDHRLDPRKSTVAALDYLEDLYLMYNDWYLALAAYNAGPGRVNRAIRYSGIENPSFWDIQNHLPRETRRYVPKFIAAVYVMTYSDQIGLLPNWQEYEDVRAEVEELDKAKYNRKVIYQAMAIESIPANSTIVTYTVKSGDNLGFIAEWYDVSASKIRTWNGISGNLIKPGQQLDIYVPAEQAHIYADIDKISGSKSKRNEQQSESNESPVIASTSNRNFIVYTIQSGDTLWDISRKNGVSIEEIKQLNNITNTRNLKPGMVIKLREKS